MLCIGLNKDIVERWNKMKGTPPRQCPKCGEKLQYWVDRETQNRVMGWSYPARFTFCCPECGKFDVK